MRRALRTLIVDDEPVARELLQLLLGRQEGVEVIGCCSDGDAALATIRGERPDLVLLDVRMPGLDGFALLEQLAREERPGVVFVTAHEEFALEAFGVRALDYLLKPVDEQRLTETLRRAREMLEPQPWRRFQQRLDDLEPSEPGTGTAEWFVVGRGKQRIPLRWEEVVWIESAGNYARVHAAGQTFLLRAPLTELEARLTTLPFARIHRSALLNVTRIVSLRPTGHGDFRAEMADGASLPISRRFRARLEAILGRLA